MNALNNSSKMKEIARGKRRKTEQEELGQEEKEQGGQEEILKRDSFAQNVSEKIKSKKVTYW